MRRQSLEAGQLLVREGDAPGPMYVICSGRVRVYRHDVTSVDSTIDLATLGVGDVIGELAPILGQLRSASVQAIEPTQVLEIPADQLQNVMQQYQPLLRVVALALRERSELSDEQITAIAARLGLPLPTELAPDTDGEPMAHSGQMLPVPTHDTTITYPKTVDCPACGTRFAALTMRMLKDQPAARESDFHNTYRSSYNPYDYEVWVCPNDYYAALPAEFPGLREQDRAQVGPIVEQVATQWADGRPDFNVDRTLELRQRSLELAFAQYQMRQAPHLRLAAIAHRLAWCARERGDVAVEHTWLRQALDNYRGGYAVADLGDAKEELRVQYLCGELSLRLGDLDEAVTWFAQASRHPKLSDSPTWERMIRDQWGSARSSVSALTERDDA
jgi:uncharacterized protein (DUF2225 family)